jgi:hypothetical protein
VLFFHNEPLSVCYIGIIIYKSMPRSRVLT